MPIDRDKTYDRTAMDFSEEKGISIEVKGPDGKDYELREATGAVGVEYQNAMLARIKKIGKGGAVEQIGKMGDLEPILVHHCLYVAGTSDRVAESVIAEWPSRVVKKLYERAKHISDIEDVEASAEAKALKAAISREDSPYYWDEFVAWAEGVCDEDELKWAGLKALLPTEDEKAAKNEPAGTTGGSD